MFYLQDGKRRQCKQQSNAQGSSHRYYSECVQSSPIDYIFGTKCTANSFLGRIWATGNAFLSTFEGEDGATNKNVPQWKEYKLVLYN